MLEKNPISGGGRVSREIAARLQARHNATGMILVMANPMIRKGELKLKSKYGLHFVSPESTVCTLFDDQTWMGTYVDLDATCISIAKFSTRDTETSPTVS